MSQNLAHMFSVIIRTISIHCSFFWGGPFILCMTGYQKSLCITLPVLIVILCHLLVNSCAYSFEECPRCICSITAIDDEIEIGCTGSNSSRVYYIHFHTFISREVYKSITAILILQKCCRICEGKECTFYPPHIGVK